MQHSPPIQHHRRRLPTYHIMSKSVLYGLSYRDIGAGYRYAFALPTWNMTVWYIASRVVPLLRAHETHYSPFVTVYLIPFTSCDSQGDISQSSN